MTKKQKKSSRLWAAKRVKRPRTGSSTARRAKQAEVWRMRRSQGK